MKTLYIYTYICDHDNHPYLRGISGVKPQASFTLYIEDPTHLDTRSIGTSIAWYKKYKDILRQLYKVACTIFCM